MMIRSGTITRWIAAIGICIVLLVTHLGPVSCSIEEEEDLELTEEQFVYAAKTYAKAISRVTAKAKSEECKAKIEGEFRRYLEPLSFEQSLPFDRITYWSQCETVKKPTLLGQHFRSETPPKKGPQRSFPPRVNTTLNADTLSIVYVLMIHDHANFAIRIIEALNESMHNFVVHVDKKSESTYTAMTIFAQDKPNVFVLTDRVSGNWGGFSLVNMTLIGMKFAIQNQLNFDFLVDISGQSYPIKSNAVIRSTLAVDPNAIYMDIRQDPNVPAPELWHHYVECDDAAHRITRLQAPRGIYMFMGSQWFILPRHVVEWFLTDLLPVGFVDYAQHIMVADEHYFTTMIKNSPYCADHVNKNYNYLVFGEWEQQLRSSMLERDLRKCNQPDPEHCGRSPTTLTRQFERSVKSSRALFARKFDPANSTSMAFVDVVDQIRAIPPIDFNAEEDPYYTFMIRQRLVNASEDALKESLCLQLGSVSSGNKMTAGVCDPYDLTQWFNTGQCIEVGGETRETKKAGEQMCGGKVADEPDQFCFFKTAARQIKNATDSTGHTSIPFCLDIAGENPRPGGTMIGYDCTGGWNQHFRVLPDCTISAVQPKAVAVARGIKQPEELTVCVKIKKDRDRYVVLTAACQEASKDEDLMTFDFIREYEGKQWSDVKPKSSESPPKPTPGSSPTAIKPEKSNKRPVRTLARDFGTGGKIKKEL